MNSSSSHTPSDGSLSNGLAIGPSASHDGREVLDRPVLLSDLNLCGAALDREAKDRRVLHSVVPRTLRGITITNLLFSVLSVAGRAAGSPK